MSVAVDKVEGVESVRVSLEEGLAEIALGPNNRVDPEVFLEIVRDNGFTPGAAEIVVAGTLVESGGLHLIEIDGPDLVYELVERAVAVPAKAVAGRVVSVRGRLTESPTADGKWRQLWLLEFQAVTMDGS